MHSPHRTCGPAERAPSVPATARSTPRRRRAAPAAARRSAAAAAPAAASRPEGLARWFALDAGAVRGDYERLARCFAMDDGRKEAEGAWTVGRADLVLLDRFGQAAVAVDVGEVELAAGSQGPVEDGRRVDRH